MKKLFAVCFVSIACLACTADQVSEGETLAAGRVRSVVEGPASVRAFIVELGEGRVALVDAGTDREGKAIIDALEGLGREPSDVEAIFLTHGHPDHIGGVEAFQGARVFALATEVDLIEGRAAAPRPLPRLSDPEPTGVGVTDVLDDGAVVALGGAVFEVFAVEGHTAGSAAIFVHGVLFLGDAASANNEGGLDNALWLFSTDTEKNLASLEALVARLEPRAEEVLALAFGHSRALARGLEPLRTLVERE